MSESKCSRKFNHRSALILCFSAEMDSVMSITGRAFHNLTTLFKYNKFRWVFDKIGIKDLSLMWVDVGTRMAIVGPEMFWSRLY